jgi:surface protein
MEPINNANIRNMIYNYVEENNSNNYPPIGTWDVSAVTDMRSLFKDATRFNKDISAWNVSNVTSMDSMFKGAAKFNQPLNNWNVSNVTDMDSMFYDAAKFNQPLDNWNVSKVTNMNRMFAYAVTFNQPLNTWDVGNVATMNSMFRDARAFNQPLNNWDFNEVIQMDNMFIGAINFDQDLSDWNIPSSLRDRLGLANSNNSSNTRKRKQQTDLQSEINKRVKMEAVNQQINDSPYEECIICGDLLNNVIGPGDSEKCGQNCNDVVSVCRNNHRFHRGCILNACNADPVNIAAQMGFEQYETNRPQQRRNNCPVCQVELLYPCEQFKTVEKVSEEELKNGKTGGRKRKTRKRNKKSNRKTKKRKHRKLKRRNYTKKKI